MTSRPAAMADRETGAAAMTADSRAWTGLALASLSLAALLALVLAASRTPGVMNLLPADWDGSFRRVLVTHVVFSFLVWCLAAFAALTSVLSQGAPGAWLGRAGLFAALGGVLLLLATTISGAGAPVMSDYVPVIDHPAYHLGLALLGAGVAAATVRFLGWGAPWRDPLRFAVAVAGIAILSALACFALAGIALPAGLDPLVRAQLLVWGGGHVLQFAYTALAVGGWHFLAERAFGGAPLPAGAARLLLATLLPAVLAAPLVTWWLGPLGDGYLGAFTEMMRWGMPLAPAVFGAAAARLAWRRRGRAGDPAAVALILSVALFGLGGLAGFFSVGGDTRTPGHYHASLSGVNLALMGMLLAVAAPRLERLRAAAATLAAFGVGQSLFAAGMFAAGTAGVPRKTAGAAQGLDQAHETVAMSLAGLGGLIAVLAALAFVALLASHLAARRRPAPEPRSVPRLAG